MADCVREETPIRTNGDLALAYRNLLRDFNLCNADKPALREWAKSAR